MGISYSIATAAIVSEVIDGEAIIMDMGSGTYYSADGLGACIWEALTHGATRADVVQWIEASFPAESSAATSDFIDRLVDAQLLRPGEPAASASPALATPTCAYAPPRLVMHTDMQDLIMIDPIHDVDEVGWPVRKVEAAH